MATSPPFDERGVYVATIHLSMMVRADRGGWRELLTRLPPSLKPTGPAAADPTAAYFVALPEKLEAHAHFFEAQVNVVELEDEVAQWDMALLSTPSADPPRAFVDASNRLGGYPGVLESLAMSWPAVQPTTAKHTVTYWASPTAWKGVKGALRPKEVRLPGKTHRLRPRNAGWTVEPARGCVAGIAQSWGPTKLVVVAASGSLSVTVNARMFEEVERAAWKDLEGLLQRARRQA